MSRPSLKYGDSGKHVEDLQVLLNGNLKNEDRTDWDYRHDIKVNGQYNTHTKRFVEMYQNAANLYKDGKVGKMTWAALLDQEKYNCFDLPEFVQASDPTDCWAASTAMLLDQPTPINKSMVLDNTIDFETRTDGCVGGLGNSDDNMRKFARYFNFEMVKGELTCQQLCELFKYYGRIMLNMKGVNSYMRGGKSEDSHLIILVGLRGGGNANDTTLLMYNPSCTPGNAGVRINCSYQYFRNQYSKFTHQAFYFLANWSEPIYKSNGFKSY
jgi:hypothetical protein